MGVWGTRDTPKTYRESSGFCTMQRLHHAQSDIPQGFWCPIHSSHIMSGLSRPNLHPVQDMHFCSRSFNFCLTGS